LCLHFVQVGLTCKWADGSQRLILENFDAIHDCPSKIYHEAVPFSPSSSWLHEYYSPELLQGVKVVKGCQARWGACSRTVSLGSEPFDLAGWNDLIAAGLGSGEIVTIDTVTGICISILLGHTGSVASLAFSSDGTYLISGSCDKTVILWDIQTGGAVRTFYGHSNCVISVSISPNQTAIASGSADKTIRLWNAQMGECLCVIDRHNYNVHTVCFSPTNSQLLISAFYDNTIWQWDINGNQIGPDYSGYFVAFSSDGTHFISWWSGGARVQEAISGAVISKLQVPDAGPNFGHSSCCFSPNGKSVAYTYNGTIYIWDITSLEAHLIKTLVGQTNHITSIVFSSSLIISSQDRTIKFWQFDTPSTDPVATDSESKPPTSASIMTIRLQEKGRTIVSSDEAGVVRAWDISTGLCKVSIKTKATIISQRDAQLIDGRLLFVWCTPKRIHIWDGEKERWLKQVDLGYDYFTTHLRISGDGSRVFLLDDQHIHALSTQTGEVVGKVKLEGEPSDDPLIVCGLRVWVCFEDLKTQGWDFGITGSTPVQLSDIHPDLDRPHLNFVNNTKRQNAGPSRIKDTITGKEVYQLPTEPTAAWWDGQYLVTGYKSGEVIVLDFNCMIPQ